MAQQFASLDEKLADFVARQHIFFCASATGDSRVNLTPRSTEYFRICNPTQAAFLDLVGSGNETAAHMMADGRMTLMFCAFEGPPMILRLYGTGRAVRRESDEFQALWDAHFDGTVPRNARQIFVQTIDLVQTSCGYGVPLFEFGKERASLSNWAAAQSDDALDAYKREKNATSMDGLPTGLFD